MPKIALIGDFDATGTAYVAIPKALEIAAQRSGHKGQPVGIDTTEITDAADSLSGFDAVWCVPASFRRQASQQVPQGGPRPTPRPFVVQSAAKQ